MAAAAKHCPGNSMGAHSVVAFALINPERTDKLVLMCGGTGGVSSLPTRRW